LTVHLLQIRAAKLAWQGVRHIPSLLDARTPALPNPCGLLGYRLCKAAPRCAVQKRKVA